MKKVILITLPTVAALSLSAVLMARRENGSAAPNTVKVCKKDLRVTLTEKGTVEASDTQSAYAQVAGEITYLIEEGTDVKKGDVVARLSNEELEESYEEAKLELELAESQLKYATKSLELLKKNLDLTVKQRESKAELARWALERVRRQADETEIKQREMMAQIRKLELEFAQLELEAARILKDESAAGAVEDYEQKKVARREAAVEHQRAQDLYESSKSEPNRKRLEVAVGRLQQAERFLAQAKLSREERIVVEAKEIEIRKANAKKVRDRVENLEREVGHLVVTSPASGKVVYPEVFKGSGEERSRVKVGETRWRGGDLMVISDVSDMVVRAPVNECDVWRVKLGQQASVRLLAYPERTYHAEVIKIFLHAVDKNRRLGWLAMMREGLAGVASVDVLLKINDLDERVRLGLTAEVEITIDVVKDALVIPRTAVKYVDGQPICRVVTGDRETDQPVTLGACNDFEVVVLDSLSDGDILIDGICRQ